MEDLERQKEQIKKIFRSLDKLSKDKARSKISEEFKITVDVAKNHWIYGGNIPEANVPKVLEIVSEVLSTRIDNMQELVSWKV